MSISVFAPPRVGRFTNPDPQDGVSRTEAGVEDEGANVVNARPPPAMVERGSAVFWGWPCTAECPGWDSNSHQVHDD
jgi:hypothetical protein